VKVKQAQADVTAKNEIISQKDADIDRLGKEVKNEQTKAEAACDARIGKQRREYAEKEQQLTQIKDDEIKSAKDAAQKAEAATASERENCATEAEAAKGRCQQEVDSVKEQVTQLQGSIKEKNEAIKNAGEQCNEQVSAAKNACNDEKKGVLEQSRQACDVEVANEREKVKTADQNLIAEKKKLADIEKRLTQDKDDAIAKCEEQKDAIDRASRDAITKNQREERDTCDKQKKVLKASAKGIQDHLHQEIFQLRTDYKNAIKTMQETQAQELKALRAQLRDAERKRDDFKDKFSNCNLKYKQVEQQLQQNLAVAKSASLNLNSNGVNLEEDVASAVGPQDMAVSSGAMVVYISLICSSLFLSGLVIKLRGDTIRHKNYNTVLTEA